MEHEIARSVQKSAGWNGLYKTILRNGVEF
jgi:hypothetical protein